MKIIIVKEKKFKEKLALIWCALNICVPKGTMKIYDVMEAIESIVGKKSVMKRWREYLREKKEDVDWLKKEIKK